MVTAASVVVLLTAAGFGPARAQDPQSAPDAQARALADEVLRRAGEADAGGLGPWTRDLIDRALGRAGDAAGGTPRGTESETRRGAARTPLPAEGHARAVQSGLAGRGNTAEVLVFTSLAVPAASWRQWAGEAALTGAPLVLRGAAPGGLRATVKALGARLGGARAGVAIDPRLFRLFGVERVPAVVVVPGGVPACERRGCAGDAAPPHDHVAGNIGLAAALHAVASEGGEGRAVARRTLERLRGEDR